MVILCELNIERNIGFVSVTNDFIDVICGTDGTIMNCRLVTLTVRNKKKDD